MLFLIDSMGNGITNKRRPDQYTCTAWQGSSEAGR